MRDCFKILMVALILAGTMLVSTAEAAGPGRILARNPILAKAETCKPKWPYIVLICVA